MAENHNHLVIMAGGVGSRFWPMSTEDKPKQFIQSSLSTYLAWDVLLCNLLTTVSRVYAQQRMYGL